MTAYVNSILNRKTLEQFNKIRNWFFTHIKQIDKPLARQERKKGREREDKDY